MTNEKADWSKAAMTLEITTFTLEEIGSPHASAVLLQHFDSEEGLKSFYWAIPTQAEREQFLLVCAKYRYMVKEGDWVSTVNNESRVVDYLTNSNKLLAIFALIESLSNVKHMEFFDWLKLQGNFPIESKKTLNDLHQLYKVEHGSIKKVMKFFERLSADHQARLCGLLTKHKQPMENIKKLAQFLYDMRSKFAHECKPAVSIHSNDHIQYLSKDLVLVKITIADIMEAFELGLIAHFRERPATPT
ncbi:hypothetical protein CY658_03065 [Variovorax sp. RO1]|uniref:hypothetical protein n=1 Tax=Variovorax sp. RO1 TaxID=2066034 RepID=UPI000CB0C3EE|nr:hypothetical protein [Variovorax sp. RO1]PLC06042.1 hypothetical protein CY658_03065 [Variovorax sp. RO1]